MKKSLFIILMVCLAVVGLVSCKNEVEPVQEELVSVSFENGTTRALTATLEDFDVDDYYWSYAAKKNDGSGLKSGQTAWETTETKTGAGSVAVQSGKGLNDDNDDPVKVPGFSKGYWNFRLFAYTDSERQNLVYWGEVDSVLIDSTHHLASVTVSPVSGADGYLKIGTITFIPASDISVPTDLVVYTDEVFKLEKVGDVDKWVIVDVDPVDGIYTLPARQYKFTRTYSFDGIPVANGSVIVTIYSNLTTTVSGTLSELTTYAEFEGKQNPDIVRETWGTSKIEEDATGTINFQKNLDPAATEKVASATMPATAAVAKIKELEKVVGADDNTSSSLKLNLSVDTTDVRQQSVTYDIGMEAVLTYTKNQTQSVAKSDVKNVDDYVIVVIDIDSDISDVSVTHSGVAMIKYTDYDAFLAATVDNDALINPLDPSEGYKGFYCLRTVGEAKTLNIKTRSFSPFEVTYEMTNYVAAIGNVKYTTLTAAIAAAKPGDTIVILDNITTNAGYLVDKNLSIDTHGYTITVNEGANINNRAFKVAEGKKLSVYGGGTIDAKGASGTGCYGAFRAEVGAELNLEGITLKNYRNNGLNVKVLGGTATLKNVTIISSLGGGIEVTEANLGTQSQTGSATLNDCTFTQTGYSDHCSTTLAVSGGSELIVNSGSYTSDNYALYVFSSGGVIKVNGGTFSGNKDGVAIKAEIDTGTYPQYAGGLAISGGTFTGGYAITSPAYMVITGGTYDHDPTTYVPTEGYLIDHDTQAGKWTVIKEGDYVATVTHGTETTGYYKLADAFEHADDGDTVTLLKDISINDTALCTKSITLDGNNKTISRIRESTQAGGCILNFVGTESAPLNLIVKNLNVVGVNTNGIIFEACIQKAVVNDCSISTENRTPAYIGDGSPVNSVYVELNNTDMTMTGKRVGGPWGNTAIGVTYGATAIVTGGTYTGPLAAYIMSSGGKLTINEGSSFVSTGNSEYAGDGIRVDRDYSVVKEGNKGVDYSDSVLTINGGSFKNISHINLWNSGNQGDPDWDDKVLVYIKGGDFENYSIAGVSSPWCLAEITGGTFDADPSAYVADGYTAVAQGTTPETWVVVKADVQVQTGTETVAYMTLGQFRDYVNAGTSYVGKTVTLLDSVDLKNNEWTPIGTEDHPFNGVFDGNGKTISNLKVTETGMFSGLFGVVCGSAANAQFDEIDDVFNLSTDALVDDLDTKIAASNYSAVVKNLTIDGFTVDCWIDGENNEEEARYSGALVGSAKYAYIGNCDVTNGTVTGCKAFGGVIGRIDGSAVVDCNTTSKVTVIAKANLVGQEAGGFNFGGIIGATSYKFDSNYGRNIVKDCTNLATLRKTDGEAKGSIAGIIGFGQNGGYQTPSIVVNCVHNGTIECSTGVGDVAGIAGGCVNVLYFVGCSNTDNFSSVTGTVAQNAGIATAPSSNNHNWRAIDCSTCELTAPTHTDKWNQILNCVNDKKTIVNCTYGTTSGINYPEVAQGD